MSFYPLSKKVREIFSRHAVNSDQLEKELSDIMIPMQDSKSTDEIVETEIPIIQDDPEKNLLRKMYPSLHKR